jgi:hypothetical protein
LRDTTVAQIKETVADTGTGRANSNSFIDPLIAQEVAEDAEKKTSTLCELRHPEKAYCRVLSCLCGLL